jgi:alkylglycerol monooxygenase
LKLIVASIPLFFILIGIELVATRILERRVYRFADSFADLGCGMIEQLLGVFVKGALFAGYLALYANARLFDLPEPSWLVFIACFLAVDFCYYWFHRKSHEVGAMWAAHSVHHQSEEYNLSVALRQGAFQSFFSWIFYLPLAVIGFSPATFITCSALNTLYQFWVHTRLIKTMGPIEWIFNTPSHHRVHHGRNPKYIDRNHAGVLIIWDRMFGTFVPETDEPVYGVVKPLASFNPLWANFAGWADLFAVAGRATSFRDRVLPFLARPGWRPADQGGPVEPPEVSRPTDETEQHPLSRALAVYVFVHFAVLVAVTAFSLARAQALGTAAFVSVALTVVVSLLILSALLEGRPFSRQLEAARLAVLAIALTVSGSGVVVQLFGQTLGQILGNP